MIKPICFSDPVFASEGIQTTLLSMLTNVISIKKPKGTQRISFNYPGREELCSVIEHENGVYYALLNNDYITSKGLDVEDIKNDVVEYLLNYPYFAYTQFIFYFNTKLVFEEYVL